MNPPPPDLSTAFGDLHRALLRRRWTVLDLRLRLELLALAGLVDGFLFWQARVAFAGLAFEHGPASVMLGSAAWLVMLALAGAWLAGAHHFRQLRRDPPGPAWLALPIPPGSLLGHLRWEARLRAWWVVTAVPPTLIALAGLAPAWWWPVAAAGFAALLVLASGWACDVAQRVADGDRARRLETPLVVRMLAVAGRPERRITLAAAAWRREATWRALLRKDLLLTRRVAGVRGRLALPAISMALSVASWWLPVEPALARFAALAFALLAAAALGGWLIALSGLDPFPTLRGLPLGASTLWGSRVVWAVPASATLMLGHAVAARSIPSGALALFLVWTVLASIAIVILATHYAITLFPRAELAQRLFSLALAIAMAASVMIPLLGWVILLAALIHSARRLPRWSSLEESP